MNINEENAKKLWIARYGNVESVQDFAGRWIYYHDYGKMEVLRQSKSGSMEDYGWNIHHIFPGGSDNENNLEIVHWKTNSDASNKSVYTILGQTYRIKRLNNSWYGIFRDSDKARVDFTFPNT